MRPSGPLRASTAVMPYRRPLIACNPATDLQHLAGIDALVKVDWPVLDCAYGQVLIKETACSLNFRDFTYRAWQLPHAGARQPRLA
jgi:hypothetical protein